MSATGSLNRSLVAVSALTAVFSVNVFLIEWGFSAVVVGCAARVVPLVAREGPQVRSSSWALILRLFR